MSSENRSNGFSLPPAKRSKTDAAGRRFGKFDNFVIDKLLVILEVLALLLLKPNVLTYEYFRWHAT